MASKDRAPDETDALLSGQLSHISSSMAPVQKASHVPQLAHLANQGSGIWGPMDVIVGEVTV